MDKRLDAKIGQQNGRHMADEVSHVLRTRKWLYDAMTNASGCEIFRNRIDFTKTVFGCVDYMGERLCQFNHFCA